MELDSKENWLNELEDFISRWEIEAETIKFRELYPDECSKISEDFHKNSDALLVRKPTEISDNNIYIRLEKLDGKLNSTLAMACSSIKKE